MAHAADRDLVVHAAGTIGCVRRIFEYADADSAIQAADHLDELLEVERDAKLDPMWAGDPLAKPSYRG